LHRRAGHARAGGGRGVRTRPRADRAAGRRRGEPRPRARRADQALRDPAARLPRRRGRGHADAEAEARRRAGALRGRDRISVRVSAVFLVLSAFLASAVEIVDSLTIVLAAGVTRGWRSSLVGVGAAT